MGLSKEEKYRVICETCQLCAGCGKPPNDGKKFHILVYKYSGKRAPGCPWNIKRIEPSDLESKCWRCFKSEQKVAQVKNDTVNFTGIYKGNPQISDTENTFSNYDKNVIPFADAMAYRGPAPKWLEQMVNALCEEASVRFDQKVEFNDLAKLLPQQQQPSDVENKPEKIIDTLVQVKQEPTRFLDIYKCNCGRHKFYCACPEHEMERDKYWKEQELQLMKVTC